MIGERIKQLRGKERQELFAERFGVSRSTILRYESGYRDPDASFIIALCREYNVSANWLLFGEGYKNVGPTYDNSNSASAEFANDEELLISILEAIEEYLADTNRKLPPKKKAQLIFALYYMFLDSEEKKVNKAVVVRLIKLAV